LALCPPCEDLKDLIAGEVSLDALRRDQTEWRNMSGKEWRAVQDILNKSKNGSKKENNGQKSR
jgi:hypothetical protein